MDFVTRAEAKARNLDQYFTGKACRHGHIAPRWVRNSDCTECNKARALRWHFQNRDAVLARLQRVAIDRADVARARSIAWAKANRSWANRSASRWKRANPKKVAASAARYLQAHLPEHRAKAALRRARKRGNGGAHTKDDVAAIMTLQRGRCAYCRKRVGRKYHVDHILALARGGPNDRTNIQILCPTCNTSKGAKHPIAFAQLIGRLL